MPRARARAWPLAGAVGGFGITYGVLARQAGFTSLETIVFSIVTFAGSAQFAAVSIVRRRDAVAAIVAALLLDARYLPIGLSVAPWLPGRPLARAAQGQVAVDESWAVSTSAAAGTTRGCSSARARLGGVGRVLDGGRPGRIGARRPRDARPRRGAPRVFLALLAGQIRERELLLAALAGAVIALAMVPLAPPSVRRRGVGGLPGGAAQAGRRGGGGVVTTTWIVVLGAGVGTLVLEGLAPAVLGGRACRRGWSARWRSWHRRCWLR